MPLRDDLLNPIDGENPGGANLRYDPVYDKIREARRQEGEGPVGNAAPRDRKSADFKLVIKLASDALATRTKDLQICAWLIEGMLQQEGFSGLRQGLDLMRGMLEKFWDTLYPEIEDGDLELRAAPVEWAGTRLNDALRNVAITRGGLGFYKYKESRAMGYEADAAESEKKRADREAGIAEGKITGEDFDKDAAATPTAQYQAWAAEIDGCLATIDSLRTFCDEKFGNSAPSFSPLRTASEEVRLAIGQIIETRLPTQPAAEPEPEPPQEYDSTPGAAAAPAQRRKASAAGIDPADPEDAAARLDAVARFLRRQDASSPAPYLLLRGYRWGELRGYGDPPDPTVLAPPSSDVRQHIRRLSLEGNWSEVLEAAESAMAQPCGRAWLDLQRNAVRAAEECGYAQAASAIRSGLRALLADLPHLPEWTLMDDTPTANAETREWLKELLPAASAAAHVEFAPVFDEPEASAALSLEAMPGEPVPPDTFTLALEAARSGRTAEAIQILADDIPRQQSGRARFQRKLQLAQICMMTGHETLAQPMLEELAASIEQHRLEEWEASGVVAHPLGMLYKCLSKLHGDAEVKQKLYARISRLDPVQALEFGR